LQFIKLAGICGILLTLISLTGVLVASVIFHLDWSSNTLSDMGDDDAQYTKDLFNFSLMIGGVFSIIFSLGGLQQSQHAITKIGFILLVVSSFVLIGVGIFHLPDPLHIPFASAFFLFSPLAVFMIGIGLIQENKLSSAVFAFVASIIGFIFTGIMTMVFLDMSFGVLNATTEFIVVVSIASWVSFYSLKLLCTK
jgi:hypothetical membrane protein